mgnify:CR=1 FL=1
MDLKGLKDELLSNNYKNITTATNGAEALDKLASETHEVAILDIEMPLLTGFEVINKCQEKNLKTKFIILTSHKESRYIFKAKSLNISGYLLKDEPFSEIQALLAKVDSLSKLIIGYDHHFGKNREGNIEQLTEYSSLYDFKVEEIPAQDIDDVSVSSTKIRKALASGNLKTANSYLGYCYMLNGKVINGKHLGGKIGFPTANIDVKEDYKLIPKTGVYVVKSNINNIIVFGMMNIGNRPTVDGKHQTIEIHFFDFNQDLYDEILTIELIYFLRDEQKFSLTLRSKKTFNEKLNYSRNMLFQIQWDICSDLESYDIKVELKEVFLVRIIVRKFDGNCITVIRQCVSISEETVPRNDCNCSCDINPTNIFIMI